MKLSDIQQSWEEDSRINELDLGKEAIRVPTLHSKYLTYLSKAKLLLRKAESDYLTARRIKFKYYKGEMTQEELETLGWSQFQGNKPLRTELNEIIDVDPDIIELQDKVEYFKTVIYTLEQILRSINSRTWDIKTAVEYQKMTNGLM